MSMQIKSFFALLVVTLSLVVMPALVSAQVTSPAPYVSEHRDTCIKELAKDAQIRVACMTQYSNEYHDQDAKQITKNNKHVVMSYAAIWIIITVFVMGMWLRQRRLNDEIQRLEEELKKAVAE